MEQLSGKVYPNGFGKSRLLEVFLSFRDFGCTPDDYLFDLAIARRGETNGEKHCYWREDEHGRLFVEGFLLADKTKVIMITKNGFVLIPSSCRVFISYAREDIRFAKRLYKTLRQRGAKPWLDGEDLVPGQNWEIEIEAQIHQSDFFIALLSKRSVGKRGFVQKEIRFALDVLERMPEKDIFMIPVRLSDCEPSHKAIKNLHYVDLFPSWKDGVRRILLSMKLIAA